MERIQCTTVTDTLCQAMEKADKMDGVLILYYRKTGEHDEIGCSLGSDDMKADAVLWLLEQYKVWLLGLARRE